jgi:hypothetical protein
VSLTGLNAATTYHYRVRSKDASNNLAIGVDKTFSTPAASAFSAQLGDRHSIRTGGVWETPYNGVNWPIATQYAGDGTGVLWFDPLAGTSTFRVQVWYANGSTVEVNAN